MLCEMPNDINECPYFIQDGQKCSYQNKCSFQQLQIEESEVSYKREPRWYEKYYRTNN